jgi:OOP family OmpA-OmpF porin
MSKKIIYLLLIALTILLGTYLYHKFCCCNCEQSKSENDSSTTKTSLNLHQFSIEDGSFRFKTKDNFKFLNSNSNLILPISDSLNLGLDNLKNHIFSNPSKRMKITGFAKENEKNESIFPNLGIARATSIKNYLVKKGFDASKFELEGVIEKNWMTNGDTILGPNLFKIFNIDEAKTEDWSSLKQSINADPLVLYFKTNQTAVNLSEAERQKVLDIVKYLDNVPNSILKIEGHTDNVGDRLLNIKLGLKRANFVKEYLGKNGIDSTKINTSSQGPDQPKSSNDTEEAKAKNRRSIITIN